MQVHKFIIRPSADALYRYHEWRLVKQPDGAKASEYVPLGLYRFLKFVTHLHSFQDMVAYEGVGGPDDGKGFVCPLDDFLRHFTEEKTGGPTPVRAAGPPPLEKVAAAFQAGSGW